MKKYLFFISVVFMGLIVSCKSEKKEGLSEAAQKNLDATHGVTKAFETGDVSKIDDYVAADFVDHTDKGETGRDSLKSMIKAMHGVDPTMKMETIKELADDEYVFEWMRNKGTSDGSMGMPKGPYDMRSIEVIKFKDGKAVEHWTYMEPADMMKMMPPPPTMMTDTVKGSKMDGPK